MDQTMVRSQGSCSSSSADHATRVYEVFLSFHGKDTRTTFTGYLYDALTRNGFKTYRDDEDLQVGEFIKLELLEAIEASCSAIVVLSENYASSRWCLDELANIVRCKEERQLTLYPIFYHVNPSDVRHQRESFERALREHELDSGISAERLKTWKSAFETVGSISGWHITRDQYEHERIREIVGKIYQDLQEILPRDVTQYLVGIEPRGEEVIERLSLKSNDVRFLVIYGMSGIGKTTLARHVYDKISNQFQGCCFVSVEDIPVESNKFCELQKKILKDILKKKNIFIANVLDGVKQLRTRLHGLKILLILDNVNHVAQLKHLARETHWFGPGSRVILTTTNEDLLNALRVEDGQKYKCELLGPNDARMLFCKEAFGTDHPEQSFKMLTHDILKLADGLPLAIVVFGSLLSGKADKCYWTDTLEMLQQNSYDSIVGRLEVCYHRLGKNEQETFVYLACFLEGKWSIDLPYISSILKDIGLHPTHGINNLINSSLVNVNTEDNRLLVHDQLKHMCWEVLRKKSPDDPGKRMALKSRGDIVDIMTSKKGTEAIRIINDESYGPEVEQCYGDPGCFSNMTRLAFLRIKNILFVNGLEYLSNNLRIIEWYECPLKTLPPTFEPKHLFKLEMCGSQIEKLWEKKVIDLPNLRSIDLSFSKNLTEVPDLSMTPCLTKLFLIDCTSLVKIHQSILSHKKLQFVGLVGCKRLENLGSKSIDMPGLVRFNLAGCSNLQTIPEFREQTRNLRYLYLDRTNLKKLPESLGLLQSLSCLSASGTAIKEVPTSFRQLKVLEDLCLEGCRLSSTSPGLLEDCNPSGMYWPSHLRVLDFAIPPTRVGDCSAGMNDQKDQSLPKLPRSRTSADYELEYDNNMVKSIVVSCWNCPRLVENESGGSIAVTMLRKYLEVGSIFKDIPQASFEIVAAGSEISQWFSYQGAGNSVTVDQLPSGWYGDEWIGIALCAVIDFCCAEQGNSLAFCPDPHPFDAYIHADGREIRIPLPVHITKCKFENQIVRYLSVNNFLRQSVDWSTIHQFHVSFDAPAEEWEVKSCAASMIWKTDLDE